MSILRNYTPKEYNGTPQIFAILQDRRGATSFNSSPRLTLGAAYAR